MTDTYTSLQDTSLIARLHQGAVGILPTDTLYGLVASAHNPEAVARLYALKQREQKPGTTIAASVEQLADIGISKEYLERVKRFWPGAISIILPVPEQVAHIHQGRGDSPFRVVADPAVRALLEKTGPLVTSSANYPGEPPAVNVAEAQGYFSDQVDFYVDGGDIGHRPPSTIIRASPEGKIALIRAGAVPINEKGE